LIDAHDGIEIITQRIKTTDKRKLLWIIGFVAFFLSAFLGNLTTTIVMISLIRKLVKDEKIAGCLLAWLLLPRINFFWYLKLIGWLALLGYASGAIVYMLQEALLR